MNGKPVSCFLVGRSGRDSIGRAVPGGTGRDWVVVVRGASYTARSKIDAIRILFRAGAQVVDERWILQRK